MVTGKVPFQPEVAAADEQELSVQNQQVSTTNKQNSAPHAICLVVRIIDEVLALLDVDDFDDEGASEL